jgi:predicted nucleotidyltransferase
MIDVKECRRTLERRLEAKRATNRGLWRRARNDANRLVDHITKSYHPEKVIQWGSVLDADRFDSRSDIDIAVEGDFDAETWFKLLGEAWAMTEFPLDLVDLRHMEPEFADIIRMKGTVVYARNPRSD